MRFRPTDCKWPLVALASMAAAACTAPAPEPTPAPPAARPTPPPVAVPTPVPTFDTWMDAPQTPGDWYYRTGGGTTRALFGEPGADARFAVTCQLGQRRVTLARAGAASGPVPMTIRTETATRAVAATPGGDLPSLVATLGASDPLLDAIAFSKGRFAVEVAGQPALYLPSWPEITRVIEDCRG
ncbi:hypothetical protein [Tsuneonella amylolytica]|uniref:hypothetical protein n=1 Tax=Tsuneonella amylolytica TaxID=2338327 RepID=UPI0013C48A1E|nr:hypothetical protein [Tsuneonella amylolytica]